MRRGENMVTGEDACIPGFRGGVAVSGQQKVMCFDSNKWGMRESRILLSVSGAHSLKMTVN